MNKLKKNMVCYLTLIMACVLILSACGNSDSNNRVENAQDIVSTEEVEQTESLEMSDDSFAEKEDTEIVNTNTEAFDESEDNVSGESAVESTQKENDTEHIEEPPKDDASVDNNTEPVVEQWKITQYGDSGGNVMLFYTIEDSAGNLVVIDGGYDTNADNVRAVIAEHGNHVSAWIITHPHPDHTMAFNAIMSNPGEIVVDNIYTIAVNYDRYRETAQDYDRFDVYETFLNITNGLSNVTYLKENDEVNLLGLRMKVLHVWDEHTDGLEVNALNNGSMIFFVEGNEEKMLFCADVENETEQVIIDRHAYELDADYVQLGHHGNWGMTTNIYDYMSPKAVFFDVPEWLVNTSDASYDAWKLKDYFVNRGIDIYIINSVPNQIVLH